MRKKTAPARRLIRSAAARQRDVDDSPARPVKDILSKSVQIKLHKMTTSDIADMKTVNEKPSKPQTAKRSRNKSKAKVPRPPAKPVRRSVPGPLRPAAPAATKRYSIVVYANEDTPSTSSEGDKSQRPVCVVLPSASPLKTLKPMPTIYQRSNDKLRLTSNKPSASSILCKLCGEVIDPFQIDTGHRHQCGITVLEASVKEVTAPTPDAKKAKLDDSQDETERAVAEIVIEDDGEVSIPASPVFSPETSLRSTEDRPESGLATSGENQTDNQTAENSQKLVQSAISMLKKTSTVTQSNLANKKLMSTDGSIALFTPNKKRPADNSSNNIHKKETTPSVSDKKGTTPNSADLEGKTPGSNRENDVSAGISTPSDDQANDSADRSVVDGADKESTQQTAVESKYPRNLVSEVILIFSVV